MAPQVRTAYTALQSKANFKVGDIVFLVRDYESVLDFQIAPAACRDYYLESQCEYKIVGIENTGIEIQMLDGCDINVVPFYVLTFVRSGNIFKLNDEYDAVINENRQCIEVGCQEILFAKVLELADKIRSLDDNSASAIIAKMRKRKAKTA